MFIKRPLLIRFSADRLKLMGIVLGIVFLFLLISISAWIEPVWKLDGHPLAGKIIAIDPGHGGVDGGSSSKQGDLEKEITLKISQRLKDLLEQSGAIVVMTRETDQDLADENTKKIRKRKMEDLFKRAERIESIRPNFTISVHLNATPSEKWSGAQTFYNDKIPANKFLAQTIQEELKKQLENTDREAKSIRNVFLLRVLNMPNALVEVGFLSNPGERDLLITEEYQQKLAESIYRGLIRYEETQEKVELGSGD